MFRTRSDVDIDVEVSILGPDNRAGLAVGLVVLVAALVVALVTVAVGLAAAPGVRVAERFGVTERLGVLLGRDWRIGAGEEVAFGLLLVVAGGFPVIALVVLVLVVVWFVGLLVGLVVGVGLVVLGLAHASVALSQEVGVALTLVALAIDTAFDRGTRLGEVDVLALDSLTLARTVDVGDEDRRQTVEALRVGVVGHGGVGGLLLVVVLFVHVTLLITTLATNVDLGAVHVHLAVANFVEPGPGEKSLTRGRVGGHGELVLLVDGAATQYGVNDMEVLALVV